MEMISIKDHIDQQHREYAAYDNIRNIGHIADGLKPSQRKIIHTVLETVKGQTQIKVANLGSRASDLTHYQHGEDSIIEAVVGLAQDFTGANNLPLLGKEGQFGTKMDHESSEPRYIYVKRSKALEAVFDENDLPILKEQFTDGEKIEPEFFIPKVPLILINGTRGVGNGYSSRILPRTLPEVKKAIKDQLAGRPVKLMPSFNGYTGSVSMNGSQIKVVGKVEKIGRTKLRITELPPDSSFQYEKYKERVLLPLLDSKQIRGFEDESSEHKWDIVIEAPMEFCNITPAQLEAKLGLIFSVTETLNCWGWDGKIKMYAKVEDLLKDWIEGRLVYLEQRRLSMISVKEKEIEWLNIKKNFIQLWNQAHETMVKCSREELSQAIKSAGVTQEEEVINRLLSLRISSLTKEQVEELETEIAGKGQEVERLRTTTAQAMLVEDIDSVK